jgi:hypothetical protein
MGEDAEVFVFDHNAYLTEVVPAFVELLRSGRIVDWLHPFLKRQEIEPSRWQASDLTRYLAALNSDLSWAGPYDLQDTYGDRWQQRWSSLAQGSEAGPNDETVAEVNWLFKIAVSIKCLGESQFVGRSMTVSNYREVLSGLGVKQDDRFVDLLAALGKRGFMIGYQFGFGFEGVNGWLDPAETAEFARRLESLDTPIFSVVHAVSKKAVGEGRGILWGNGLMTAEYYLSERYHR